MSIDLGYKRPDYSSDGPTIAGSKRKMVTDYPQLSLNDKELPEGTPNTGTATITYRIRRVDTGGSAGGSKPSVDLEVKSIEFPGQSEKPKKKSRDVSADYLAKALAGTAADNGEEGSPSEEAGESPAEEESEEPEGEGEGEEGEEEDGK